MHWKGGADMEGEGPANEQTCVVKGEECFTDCELQSVCSSITDP